MFVGFMLDFSFSVLIGGRRGISLTRRIESRRGIYRGW